MIHEMIPKSTNRVQERTDRSCIDATLEIAED